MQNYLDIAKEAVTLGALSAKKYFNSTLTVELKEDRSPVTQADKDTEQKIKDFILSKIPDAKFVGEESGGNYDGDEYWLIDPIDGTAFFARGIPLWGTLVTYVRQGQAIIGASYIPFADELMYAEKGKGAFLNGKQIHVSQRNIIADSFITYTTFFRVTDQLSGFTTLCKKAHKAKSIGDSYAFHLVATGRVEVKFDGAALPFDVAGLNLIVEEAGGRVTNFAGKQWSFKDNNVIVSNGLIHDELLKIVHQ